MAHGNPDPKPARRVRDSEAMRAMHRAEGRCRICPRTDISAHHLVPRSRGGDDVYPGNLVPLCGDGTTGHHAEVEEYRKMARFKLREALRPEEVAYVVNKRGQAWLDRQYPDGRQIQQSQAASKPTVPQRGGNRKDQVRHPGRS